MQRLSASDFSPEQIAHWIAQSGQDSGPEAEPAAEAADEWFVAYTDPRREDDVAKAVRRVAFAAYVPAMTVTKRRQSVKRPIFPRYVFLKPLAGQGFYGLRETPGLEGLVRMDGQAVTVRPDAIEGLRAYEADGTWDFTDAAVATREAGERAEAAKAFLPGVAVRIVSGPYRTFGGIVEGLLPGERISVFMKLFGRSFAVPMPLADVALA